jgi:hypothetical protein
MINRPPISILAWITGSWLGSAFTFLMSHANAIISGLTGIATLVLSIYGIFVARATLKLRKKEIEQGRSIAGDDTPLPVLAGLLIISILLTGCTFSSRTKAKVDTHLDEESRTLTTAVVDTLNAQPTVHRDAFTATALTLARQDQRIEGLPAHPIDVLPLVQSNAQAIADLTARFEMQNDLLQQQRQATDKLLQYGQQFEQQRNKSLLRRMFASFGILGTVGAIVAICVFFPVAIPIFGRVFGWLVSKLPTLASYIGVVSHKAYDQVVKGVELAKQEYAKKENSAAIDVLHASLSKSMDGSTKDLVQRRKFALGVA